MLAMAKTIILASTSPRREALMNELKRPFRVVRPQVDETVGQGLSASEAAKELAARKAEQVAGRCTEGIVLAADTLVEVNGEVLGKPRDAGDAAKILTKLSGTRHAVITGVCMIDVVSRRKLIDSETTWVTMRRLSAEEIGKYVASGEAEGKAGAYAIQESGDRYVERVEGSLSNVVGLPMEKVKEMLDELESDRER